jgi:hypothetical protein
MLAISDQAKSCAVLLEEFRGSRGEVRGKKLVFAGAGDRDVYNITAPFLDDGEPVIAGRVEYRDKEASEVMFFAERGGEWILREGAPVFALQDPFVSFVQGELVFGGVEVYFDGNDPHYVTSWRTVFYRGKRLSELKPFAKGPLTMKDIRLLDLQDGRIAVFTRPMLIEGARAMIGYAEIGSLAELTEKAIEDAKLLRALIMPDEWGGANEAFVLANGTIGVLGHIAYMEENNIRHYYPMTFALDRSSLKHTPVKLIATRDMFPDGPAKRQDLVDVLFSGGIVRNKDGTASLYTGVSDAEAHVIVIPDPFLDYEK